MVKEFSKRLKYLREKKKDKEPKWTQGYVADLIGVARPTYTAYENENNPKQPPLETVDKLADLFDVSADWLMGRTDDPSPKESKKEMNLFFYDGLEGYDDLSPEEQEAFREHMYDEARQAIELVKKLKKQGKRGGMYER